MNMKNVSIDASSSVRDIATNFLKRSGLNAFSFSRIFKDGTRAELWTDGSALSHTFLNKQYIVGAYTPILYGDNERYAILENKLNSFPKDIKERYAAQVADQRELFNYSTPFKIIKKQIDYCDYYIFYGPKENKTLVAFYLNNLNVLENFALFFEREAKILIEAAVANPIIVAAPLKSSPSASVIGTKIQVLNGVGITRRQIEIARGIASGSTSREIGEMLCISQRTVESHVENMRSRLNCGSRAELLVRLIAMGVLEA
ncbi:response regulator transcription factor [Paraburkholderia phenazinium]|uniref:response regulator transcription factor n=1 Tax=Paraburkholderia phenazinium TaxID=60549 RepID=UPI00158E5B72|nr:LuxR C-terminal-related transcriptional regulator [Paraburkholderia phenazinium]